MTSNSISSLDSPSHGRSFAPLLGPPFMWQLAAKRALDIAISLILCATIFLPLSLAVAAAIKIESPGPVLFRQPRHGHNNVPFVVFKFRTMYESETDLLADRQTSRDDRRVTRVGKWLRRLSIDELPQLLNVLRGEMSLVGPRPHALHTMVEGELLNDGCRRLHDALPGQARHHRLGASKWRPRRARHPGRSSPALGL